MQIDQSSLQTESVPVGENMIVGYSYTTNVLSKGEPVSTGSGGLSGALNTGVRYFSTKSDGFPIPGETYTIEMRFTIFETDIPPQHFWSPKSGKYKVLLTRIVRATVD